MKSLAEKIQIMQAALDGKKIEVFEYNHWARGWRSRKGEPVFNWVDYDYRIAAQETSPCWIVSSAPVMFLSKNEAIAYAQTLVVEATVKQS